MEQVNDLAAPKGCATEELSADAVRARVSGASRLGHLSKTTTNRL
ncbi:hypothetical protein [Saccharopolyspora kobensis]|nr:hypothetical protein [Saccharopolyspora kobensis]